MPKVVDIGTPGSYTPAVLIHELLDDIDDIQFIAIGVQRKNGNFEAGWSAGDDDTLGKVSFVTVILHDQIMQRAKE